MRSKAALLWDESFLWGLMAYRALEECGLDFTLINADDIRKGALSGRGLLYVPGGWASNKLKALGEEGARAVRDYVSHGGAYVGVCGGAGLATGEGLGFLAIKRKPLRERVPSLSGPVRLRLTPHPAWAGVEEPVFNIWWPSQFVCGDESVRELARFESAAGEAFSSDLGVGDVGPSGWDELEERYGLNLDPEKMAGDPLVLEAEFGRGKVLASLVHFDTPGDENGALVLKNLWQYFGAGESENKGPRRTGKPSGETFALVEELFNFGLRNFLWFQRGPLIQWRRGIRGLEYYTLYVLVRELSSYVPNPGGEKMKSLGEDLAVFAEKAKRLLMLERLALQRGERITFSEAEDPDVLKLRDELFSRSKSYGGFFKDIINKVDALLYERLKAGQHS